MLIYQGNNAMKKINIAINTRNTFLRESLVAIVNELISRSGNLKAAFSYKHNDFLDKEGANKQVISSQADSLIKISRIWADFFPANTSNQPI